MFRQSHFTTHSTAAVCVCVCERVRAIGHKSASLSQTSREGDGTTSRHKTILRRRREKQSTNFRIKTVKFVYESQLGRPTAVNEAHEHTISGVIKQSINEIVVGKGGNFSGGGSRKSFCTIFVSANKQNYCPVR